MLNYDDAAGAALNVAAEDAGRSSSAGYETPHVLLGLLRTRDPVTRRVTDAFPQVTADAVRQRLATAAPTDGSTRASSGQRPAGEPAAEFRRAMKGFTAKWRPLVRAGRLRPGLT